MADSTNANTTADSDNEDTNPNPNLSGVTFGPFSSPPALCLFSFAGNAATGAFIGSIFGLGSGLVKKKGFKGSFVDAGANAKTFAVMSGVHSLVLCVLKMLRGKDDVVNAGVAGCCTGLALSFPGAPQALLQSCVTFGAFSFIMEGLNKQQALAQSFARRHRPSSSTTSQTLALPLSVPLPDELKGAFSFFCNSLKKSKNGKYPTAQ